ncbi:MAG: dicarboxylate/amino acid:cation symporter [Proteobacteria bacterium]|nr:dicarboxylate/amino acid:cation symporter [Pseudomonadota bacterium]
MTRSLSLIVLAALLVGLLAGEWIQSTGNPQWLGAVDVVQAFGGLWLNALRMTVIPLVFSLLVVGIASVADATATGGLVARAVALFTVLLFLAAVLTILFVTSVLSLWPVDRASAASFIAGAGASAPHIAAPPSFADWLQSLAPSNPITSAAEDKVLPLVVFAIFFGFAATRLSVSMRESLAMFFRAVSETMIVIVHWVLLAGPLGVFALSLGVGAHTGFAAAGTILHYIVVVAGTLAVSTVAAFLIAIVFGRQPVGRFITAATPVWAIAFSTQSSLASLPAMLEAARRGLGISERVVDVILPLAVAVFRFTSPVGNLAVCFFIAHLYGLHPTAFQMASGVAVAYAMSIGAVGLPGQVSYIASIAPICLALGVPTDLLGIFLAVEVIPDIFRTLGNVTGDLAATCILARGEKTSSAF